MHLSESVYIIVFRLKDLSLSLRRSIIYLEKKLINKKKNLTANYEFTSDRIKFSNDLHFFKIHVSE